MKDKRGLFRGSCALIALVASLLFAFMVSTSSSESERESQKASQKATISRAEHDEIEECAYNSFSGLLEVCLISEYINYGKAEENGIRPPEEFAGIDRTPKIRLQAARSKIPDIRTNV